jgi:phage gpG-like protein
MASVKYSLDLGPFYKYLRQVLRRSENFSSVLREAMRELAKEHAKNFDSQGALVGGWQPNDTRYAGWKLEEYGRGGILVRTGTLKRSLTSVTNTRGAVRDIGRKSAEFGTSVNYAHFHQTGTRKMASREIVFTPRQFSEGLAHDAVEYLAYGRDPKGAMTRARNIGRR